jgi:hypothetical protein
MKYFPLSQHGGWAKWAGTLTRKAAERGLLSAAARTVNYIQTVAIPAAQPRPPVDRGRYKGGWRIVKLTGNGGLIGALVTNAVPYAGAIEDGVPAANVKPGKAMIDALSEWIRRKRIGQSVQRVVKTRTTKVSGAAVKKAGYKRLTSTVQVARNVVVKPSDAAVNSMAWAIAKSMQKHGIFKGTGLRILQHAEQMIPDFLQEEITRELKKG